MSTADVARPRTVRRPALVGSSATERPAGAIMHPWPMPKPPATPASCAREHDFRSHTCTRCGWHRFFAGELASILGLTRSALATARTRQSFDLPPDGTIGRRNYWVGDPELLRAYYRARVAARHRAGMARAHSLGLYRGRGRAGEQNARARLTAADVLDIRRRRDAGERLVDIHVDYPVVSVSAIRAAAIRRSWSSLL